MRRDSCFRAESVR